MGDPTRAVCARCNRRGWGFVTTDEMWAKVAGDPWMHADLCVFCFGELGDEKWIDWTDGLDIRCESMRAHREWVERNRR